MRQSGELHPEYVALGLLAEEPLHGYELYRRFKESLGSIWRISESQMYATLKRLEQRGLVVAGLGARSEGSAASGTAPGGSAPGGSAPPKTLALSASGREAFESWLLAASSPHPRCLRLEFLARLYFASRARPGLATVLLAGQRSALEATIAEREERGPDDVDGDLGLAGLASAFSQGQLKAALRWLEDEVAPALQAPPALRPERARTIERPVYGRDEPGLIVR